MRSVRAARERTRVIMPLARFLIVVLPAAFAAFRVDAPADDPFPLGLTLKDHVFGPAELKAPAGRDIAIIKASIATHAAPKRL